MIPAAIGLLAGFFGGLVGLGGGVLMVPLLTAWARLDQHRAHGTSLAGVVFTGIAGAATYAGSGDVDWQAAFWLGGASVLAASAAARYSRRVSPTALRRGFALFLAVTALLLPLKDRLDILPHVEGGGFVSILIGAGLLVGAVTGLLGVGGGSLLVPLLVLGGGLGQHIAQGTSLAAMVPAGIGGSAVHVRHRHVALAVLPGLLTGIVAGTWLGGRAAIALPGPVLRIIFAVVLVGIGAYYLYGARRADAIDAPETDGGEAGASPTDALEPPRDHTTSRVR